MKDGWVAAGPNVVRIKRRVFAVNAAPPLSVMRLPAGPVRRLSAAKQRRLDCLMDKNNEGQLDEAEREELRALAGEAEQLTIDNARRLAERR